MAALNKILCPVDFSESSMVALEHALHLAKIGSGRVHVAHVCNDPHYVRPDLMVWTEHGGARPMSEIGREQAEESMQDFLGQVPASDLARLTHSIYIGNPAQTIISLAEKDGYDLIAMGTHGRTSLGQLLMGSVTEKVVRRAACPVLVVRPDTTALVPDTPEDTSAH